MTINTTEFYKIAELMKLYPIIKKKGYIWLLRQIKNGRLPATNTSGADEQPRYIINGGDFKTFVEDLRPGK